MEEICRTGETNPMHVAKTLLYSDADCADAIQENIVPENLAEEMADYSDLVERKNPFSSGIAG